MVELELQIPIGGTPPLSVLATAKLAGFSLSVRPLFEYNRSPVLVLANGTKLLGVNLILRYLARKGTGIPNLYDRDNSETNQIYKWLEHVPTLFSDSEYEGVCKYIDGYLLRRTFLVGHSLSVADITVWSYFAGDGQRSESLMKSTEYQNLVRWYKVISTDHLKELTATSSEKEDSGKSIVSKTNEKEQGLHHNKQTTNASGKVSYAHLMSLNKLS